MPAWPFKQCTACLSALLLPRSVWQLLCQACQPVTTQTACTVALSCCRSCGVEDQPCLPCRSRINGLIITGAMFILFAAPISVLEYVPNFFFGSLMLFIGLEIMMVGALCRCW